MDSLGAIKVVFFVLSFLNDTITGLLSGHKRVENLELNPNGLRDAELETVTTPMPSCAIKILLNEQ